MQEFVKICKEEDGEVVHAKRVLFSPLFLNRTSLSSSPTQASPHSFIFHDIFNLLERLNIRYPHHTKSTTDNMGRLHSNGKGISASAIPYSRTPPAWLKTTPEQVVDQICKLAKKGATPSQIGVVLRDSHGIAQVKVVTGMSIYERE